MLDCVLFDLDGLMVDSERLQYEAYRDAFTEFGFQLGFEHWVEWHSLEASAARWIESRGLSIDAGALRAKKKVIYDDMIASRLTLKPGVHDLVEELAGSYRLCVASSSRRESIEACLAKFSLLDRFERLCSSTEVERAKPYPDVYLRALDLLGADPRRSLALEDSPSGLQAASRAGIACVVCPDEFMPKPAGAYADAVLVVDSLAEIDAARLQGLLADSLASKDDSR